MRFPVVSSCIHLHEQADTGHSVWSLDSNSRKKEKTGKIKLPRILRSTNLRMYRNTLSQRKLSSMVSSASVLKQNILIVDKTRSHVLLGAACTSETQKTWTTYLNQLSICPACPPCLQLWHQVNQLLNWASFLSLLRSTFSSDLDPPVQKQTHPHRYACKSLFHLYCNCSNSITINLELGTWSKDVAWF